jgi:hypothetical protein
MKYEYAVAEIDALSNIVAQLNRLGREEWRVVCPYPSSGPDKIAFLIEREAPLVEGITVPPLTLHTGAKV